MHITFYVGDVLPARIRALRSKTMAGKLWLRKTVQSVFGLFGLKSAFAPEHGFAKPEPSKGGEALTVC